MTRRAVPLAAALVVLFSVPALAASAFSRFYSKATGTKSAERRSELLTRAISKWKKRDGAKALSEAHNDLAYARYVLNDAAGTIKHASKAIEIYSRAGEPYVNRALGYRMRHRYHKAIRDLKRARRLLKGRHAYTVNLNLCGTYVLWGDFRSAESRCDEAVRLKPGSLKPYSVRARVYVGLGKHRKALKDVDTAFGLIDKLLRQEEMVSKSTLANSEYLLLIGRGSAHHGLRDYPKAVAVFNEALRKAPRGSQAFWRRGLSRFERGDNKGALKDMDAALRLKPRSLEALMERGTLHFKMKRYERARRDFNKALSISPIPEIHYRRARLRMALDDFDGAVSDLDTAIGGMPFFPAAYEARGRAREFTGNLEGARSDFKKACSQGSRRGCREAKRVGG